MGGDIGMLLANQLSRLGKSQTAKFKWEVHAEGVVRCRNERIVAERSLRPRRGYSAEGDNDWGWGWEVEDLGFDHFEWLRPTTGR